MAGDTLWGISLSSGVSVDNIVKANGLKIDDLIFPGQILYLPNPAETPQPQLETNKKIVVILSQQMAYAYEGEDLIMEFVVSTGVPDHPTVQGIYFIYIKLESTRMTGPGYDLPNVPWTMYFYKGYGFHGTYWHSNFGQPMSHGCVNMKTEEAEWLFRWAPIGTQVEIYP
jgi:lipoprotein-anchoring transpeptidase ErfK/SrfK